MPFQTSTERDMTLLSVEIIMENKEYCLAVATTQILVLFQIYYCQT